MNFELGVNYSIILMSQRKNAPYEDEVLENGKVLIYEGHDIPNTKDVDDPKKYNQPMYNPSGSLTQNGKFFESAQKAKREGITPKKVKVYEKIQPGIWVFNGIFNLVDAYEVKPNSRTVFKFWLELTDEFQVDSGLKNLQHTRLIPSSVKLGVWKRDNGECVLCGEKDNLHYDHDVPFSKGGSSLTLKNIRLLCARHNLSKSDKIE
ncbi:MAG: HNH endonuclease [Candidatus Marinimicrobia bacterium]|nr:HNH endonuclease [Candidatus Neomarinimicrobiota bacterium]